MEDRQLTAAEIEAFNNGLKMGQAVGNVVGGFTALVVSAALPVVPWAVGTAVLAKQGWKWGGQAGMATMVYAGTKKLNIPPAEVQS